MGVPNHVLVHTAIPLSYDEPQDTPAQWVEGEPGAQGVRAAEGTPFACVLFLPSPGGSQDTPYRPRAVRTPTVLYNATRTISRAAVPADSVPAIPQDNSLIVVTRENDLLIYAPELAIVTGSHVARWQVDGDPQPFGPPGSVIGVLAQVRAVED